MAVKKIFSNLFWILPLLTGFLAQIIKFIIYSIKEKRFAFTWLFSTGGMPSAHSAGVSCLSVITGFKFGFDSPIFGIVFYFSLLVMYDAAGIRREAGEHAELLNIIVSQISQNKELGKQRLKEFLGHSPLEVLMGAFLGILVGIIANLWRWV
ncbi:MAG: divergent PAP2 family protein [candidate division WOR-3 bacterium]